MRRKRQYIVLSFASTARAMGWEKECAARGIPGRGHAIKLHKEKFYVDS